MAFQKKKYPWYVSTFRLLNDWRLKFSMWHKENIRWWQDKLNLSYYKTYWLSFLEGVIITAAVFIFVL